MIIIIPNNGCTNNFFRIPEIFFEGSDVWKTIDEEELLVIRRLLLHFLVSNVIQRLTHALFEVNETLHYSVMFLFI